MKKISNLHSVSILILALSTVVSSVNMFESKAIANDSIRVINKHSETIKVLRERVYDLEQLHI